VSEYDEQTMPVAPEGAVTKDTFMRYNYEGVEKIAAWLPLSNGMRLNVAVPVSETEGDWQRLVWNIVILAAIVLLVSCTFTMYYARRITKPLEELTEAADQADRGNYEFELNYDSDDELGRLTHTFKRLAGHMKDHISDLNKRVYVDALTSVRNKGAYSAYIEELQTHLNEKGSQRLAFGIGVFDCDNLKWINDRYGHEKGDIYLKTASRLICHVFQHSPVFRIGGDEFSVILQNADYQNREALVQQFKEDMAEISASAKHDWEEAHIAMGIAVYEPQRDHSVNDVIRRADESMYENKRGRKAGR
jgi:diguanylate cyclase (GGDEF)-like protein